MLRNMYLEQYFYSIRYSPFLHTASSYGDHYCYRCVNRNAYGVSDTCAYSRQHRRGAVQ